MVPFLSFVFSCLGCVVEVVLLMLLVVNAFILCCYAWFLNLLLIINCYQKN
uniref:Uncharacterized protein n=1 Tax=Rhizophora mucronata TaxID=61149 RepID=A0A2P2IZ32_RHIMU